MIDWIFTQFFKSLNRKASFQYELTGCVPNVMIRVFSSRPNHVSFDGRKHASLLLPQSDSLARYVELLHFYFCGKKWDGK